MIRDFCGIAGKRLIDEIKILRDQVSTGTAKAGVHPDTIEAIDHVRQIGNIGAHMEADVNTIIDVTEEEANKLLALVELLFKDWYVAQAARVRHLADLKQTADAKRAQQNVGKQARNPV